MDVMIVRLGRTLTTTMIMTMKMIMMKIVMTKLTNLQDKW